MSEISAPATLLSQERLTMSNSPTLPTAYLEQHPREAQELLEQLCRQPSVAAQNTGIAEMAGLVEGLLSSTGFNTQRLVVEGAPPVIYGELRGRGPFTLLLYNHYDVQPAEPYDLWLSPPFEPTIRDGKLFARGSADNKSEIAARLTAIRALRTTYGELPITLRWMIEGEEEIGSPHFEAIAAKYAPLLQADGALWEGGNFDKTGRPRIVLGTKGLLYVQLDVQGTAVDAHSGNAPVLPSAAWRLVQALATLKTPEGHVRISGFYDAVQPPSQAQLEAIAGEEDNDAQVLDLYGITRFVDGLNGTARRERQAFQPTCNIAGLLSGYTGEGTKTVLPAHAMVKIDFRLVPNQDPRDILAKLQAHLRAQGYDDIQITVFSSAGPVVTPIEHPFVQRITSLAETFAGKPASIGPIIGGTLPFLDALRRHVGVPGLGAPGNAAYLGSSAHAPNEHILLSDLERAVRYNCFMFHALGE